MTAALGIAPAVGVLDACAAFGVPRATVYRRRQLRVVQTRRRPGRALSDDERAKLLRVLCSVRFVDASPAEVYATLLDEGLYLASPSTMYRLCPATTRIPQRVASRGPATGLPHRISHRDGGRIQHREIQVVDRHGANLSGLRPPIARAQLRPKGGVAGNRAPRSHPEPRAAHREHGGDGEDATLPVTPPKVPPLPGDRRTSTGRQLHSGDDERAVSP